MYILVTRPAPGGVELCRQIEAQGMQALHLPTIFFAPPHDITAFEHAIATLTQQDILIFISPQAVFATIALIRQQFPLLPSHIQWVAVGAGTKAALQAAGQHAVLCPEITWNSESVLELPLFQSIRDKKIAIIRGESGRDLLEKVFTARGAHVLPVIAYRRDIPQMDMRYYLGLLQQKKIAVIIAASNTSVQHLKILFGANGWPALRQIPLLVVSDRIKLLAENLGFQTIWVAQNASHSAILQHLLLNVLG